MGVSCGGTLIKWILFVFNFLWLLLGGLVLWLGFTITSWSGDISEVLDTNMKGGAITILVAGFLIFFIAFLGCCGACKENSCMLSTYGGIILILVIVQCVGVYFAFKYKSDINENIRDGVKKTFNKFNDDDTKAKVVQQLQKTFECCGIDGKDSWSGPLIPASCCDESFDGKPRKTCLKTNIKFDTGCVKKIGDDLSKYLGGLGGIAIALVAVQIIIILMACCLSREVRN